LKRLALVDGENQDGILASLECFGEDGAVLELRRPDGLEMPLACGNVQRVCRGLRTYIFYSVLYIPGIEGFDNEVAGVCLN